MLYGGCYTVNNIKPSGVVSYFITQSCCGTVVALKQKNETIPVWCGGGGGGGVVVVVVLWWWCGGVVVVWWWCGGGVVVVWW